MEIAEANDRVCERVIEAGESLSRALRRLRFAPPVTHVYDPLDYARAPYRAYLRKFVRGRVRVVFLGMNPGPFGMVQTGVPFGEVASVRNWLGILGAVEKPRSQHPRRPIEGFECRRSEISGFRLWGLFAQRFGSCEAFFQDHLVVNYCPLAFMEASGRNRTPDKLPAGEREALYAVCDEHLRRVTAALDPEWVIGIGDFARERAESVLGGERKVGRILHPSPASPAANRDWAGTAARQLEELGVWPGVRGPRAKGVQKKKARKNI